MKKVSILGDGAWGTAVACLLADNGYQVTIWCHDHTVADAINNTHINERYLPGVTLSPYIQATTSLQDALANAQWIFEAVPVKFLRVVLEKAKPFYNDQQTWVIMSKGIEQDTLMLPSQILDDVFKADVRKTVFSGPSFAADLAKKQITGVTIAAQSCEVGLELQTMLANSYFRPYISLDIIGVQAGGALKNIIAIGMGILKGADYTDNAQAYLFTRGLHEIVQLTTMLGGKHETVYGLSGVGDLVLTAMGNLSRNMLLGQQLGSGKTLQEISVAWGTLPEGINTVQSVHQLALKHSLNLPICNGLYQVIFHDKSTEVFLRELMARPLELECAIND
jgi:glycerol-3-phosphate dehydrogenase (NAD(P)+)